MATQDAAARLHNIVRQRMAADAAAAGCCGGTGEAPPPHAPHMTQDGAAAAVCPETREACPTPLTASEVLATFRAEADSWTVERDGGTIHGRTFGEGPPLYLLNGVLGTHELYVLLAWVLREHFRCVLFDWPAVRSARRGEPAAGPLVEDLRAVADSQGDERFSVCGTSLGGVVALSAMRRHPQRIERAMLFSAFAARRLSLFERVLVKVGRFVPGTTAGVPLRESILRENHQRWFPPFDVARFRFLLEDTGRTPLRVIARRVDLLRRTDLRPGLGEIRQPVLLVRTEGEGAVLARAQEELAAGLPNARSEWLHTCGQLPQLTHPHRLAKLLRSFVLEEAAVGSA